MSNESKTVIEYNVDAKHHVVPVATTDYVHAGDGWPFSTVTIRTSELILPTPEDFVHVTSDKGWDISQNDFVILMRVDLPSVQKNDVKAWITSNEVQVTGVRSTGPKGQTCFSHRIPHEASVEDVQGELKDGVLTLTFKRMRRPSYINVEIK